MRNGTRQRRAISTAVTAVCENLELRRLMSTVYVDAAAAGANDGADWSDAYTNLQQALTTASSGETILVAQGTYVPVLPSATANANDTFDLVEGVTLQGGYPTGGAASPDPAAYPTILSGDLGLPPDPSSVQSYNVVTSDSEDSSTVLNGFTITGGNADGGSNVTQDGGGMFDSSSSPTVMNCTFTGNTAVADGGGMYNEDDSAPTLTNCTFSNNSAPFGGGMYNEQSSPVLQNCTFSANNAAEEGGGILNKDASSPNLSACLFIENTAGNESASGYGAGMLNQDNCSPMLSNCDFIDNQSTEDGGGMFDYDNSAPQLSNCLFSGNSALLDGGAVFGTFTTGQASAIFTDCTFAGNTAEFGGGFYNYDSSPTFINCLIDGDGADDGSAVYSYQSSTVTMTNCTVDGSIVCVSFSTVEINNTILTGYLSSDGGQVSYSDIDGDYYANGIDGGDASASQYHNLIGVDPMFTGVGPAPYSLVAGSPCIGAGDAADVPAGVTADLAGNPRLTNGNVDLGAYEFTLLPEVEPMDVMVGASTGASERGPIGTGGFSDADPATGFLHSASNVSLGGSITMSWIDQNIGNTPAPGGYVDDVYLSSTPQLNASSMVVDSVTQTQTIAPGAGVPVSTTFTLPSDSFPAGTYYFVVQDNATGTFPELARTSGVAASTAVQVTPAAQTIYVDINTPAIPNLQDGTSWATAFASLQQALAVASSGDIIDVAQGTYLPSEIADPTVSFELDNGVSLYGGFAGNVNGDENGGNPGATGFTTYLSGSIGTPYTGNFGFSYSVVSADNVTSPTVFDGFTITGGFADGAGVNQGTGGGAFIDDCTSALTLSNCTFSGNTAFGGGGMYVDDSSPTLIDCAFIQDTGYGAGGGLYLAGSSPTLAGCTFSGNETFNYGGGIFNDDSSFPTLVDCTFNRNTANDGGGLYCYSDLTLVDCTFIGNQANDDDGGGIFANNASLTMIDCVLNGNTASEGGGMLLFRGSTDLVNCVLCGDGATGKDGAIYNLGSSLTITNCTITDDTAPQFGAIYTAANYGSTTITNSIVYGDGPNALGADNYAAYSVNYSDVQYGAAAGTENINADPQFQRDPNLADNDDGDLQLQPDSPAIGVGSYSAIVATGETADLAGNPRYANGQVDLGAYEFVNDGPLPDMAALNVTASTSSTTFYGQLGLSWTDANLGNASATGGYTDDVYLSTTPQLTSSSILIDSVTGSHSLAPNTSVPFSINVNIPSEATGLTPGTYYLIVDTNANGVVPEYNQNNNVAVSQAIEISSVAHTYYVDADTPASPADQDGRSWTTAFSSLQSALALAYTGDTIDVAQGIYLPSATGDPNATFQLVSDVTMQGGFGGYELGDPATPNPSDYPTVLSGNIGASLHSYFVVTGADLDASTVFDGFTVTGGEAGMELYDNSLPMISDCIFTANSGNYDGGGMYLSQSSPILTDCTFSDNYSSDYGGGIFAFYYSSPILTDCMFTDNSAGYFGGGMCVYSDSSPTLFDCSFSGNTSADSGGGMAILFTSSPTLTNCAISDNTAVGPNSAPSFEGGGIFCDDECSPILTNCTISGNSADFGGGMIFVVDCSPTLTNCAISNNTATEDGGGIYLDAGSATLTNCLLNGDGATGDGGAIYNYSSSVEITNCTIANDSAGQEAGAIFNQNGGPTTITNSIIYGDGADEIAAEISATYSDIQGSVAGADGNINANPLFVNATNNFQLQPTSPCINAGNNNAPGLAGITTDLAGNPRIVGGVVDMGAYELQNAADTWTGGGGVDVSWSDSSNWSSGVPTAATNVVIPTGYKPQLGSGTFAVASLTLGGNATVDLQSATLMIDYGSNPDPVLAVASFLSSGYKGGAWNGSGIVSSTVASENISQSARIYSVGYTDGADGITGLPSGQIEIMPTLAGDAKMQGNVVFGDFQLLSQYFGKPGTWDEGNFTYGSAVNFGDFQLLSQNFGGNSSAVAAASAVVQLAPLPSVAAADSTGIILSGAGNDTILGSWGGALLGNG
jgi:parallel beta-helix repeat protein/predicted outer membrane repeat protein